MTSAILASTCALIEVLKASISVAIEATPNYASVSNSSFLPRLLAVRPATSSSTEALTAALRSYAVAADKASIYSFSDKPSALTPATLSDHPALVAPRASWNETLIASILASTALQAVKSGTCFS